MMGLTGSLHYSEILEQVIHAERILAAEALERRTLSEPQQQQQQFADDNQQQTSKKPNNNKKRDKAKTDLVTEMKRDGVEYDERMDRLEEIEYPKPLRDELYEAFNGFREKHPWVGQENVKPKSVVRELYERVMTFGEYVSEYGMKRSEGLVLRYLTDCYRAMNQTVPDSEKTDEVVDLIEWLGEIDDDEKVKRMRRADIFCAPSLHGESFGIVLLEAMAAETTVIASALSGYRKVVECPNGKAAGRLIEPGSAHELRSGLRELLNDPEQREALVRVGADRVTAFSMTRLADLYTAAYQRLLN